MNPSLIDVGHKEWECLSVLLSHLHRFKCDARTMSLVLSFLDMSDASTGRILQEVMKNPALLEEARKTFQCPIDMECSQGQAVHHLFLLTTVLDTNVKMVRRADLLTSMELQPHLTKAAFQLPFDPTGNHLFGEGLSEILALNEDYILKRHTRRMEQALVKTIS